MRKSALLIDPVVLIAGFSATRAAEYDIDKTHSSVGFKVKHMMVSNVRGQFGGLRGHASPGTPATSAASRVNATIQTGSVDTGNEKRDEHLRGHRFLRRRRRIPTITFVSTKVEPKGKDHYALHGDLTLRGVTRPVVLDLDVRRRDGRRQGRRAHGLGGDRGDQAQRLRRRAGARRLTTAASWWVMR